MHATRVRHEFFNKFRSWHLPTAFGSCNLWDVSRDSCWEWEFWLWWWRRSLLSFCQRPSLTGRHQAGHSRWRWWKPYPLRSSRTVEENCVVSGGFFFFWCDSNWFYLVQGKLGPPPLCCPIQLTCNIRQEVRRCRENYNNSVICGAGQSCALKGVAVWLWKDLLKRTNKKIGSTLSFPAHPFQCCSA